MTSYILPSDFYSILVYLQSPVSLVVSDQKQCHVLVPDLVVHQINAFFVDNKVLPGEVVCYMCSCLPMLNALLSVKL